MSNLARDGIAPKVTIIDTVTVEIRRPQPQAPRRMFRDDGTVQAFFSWQSKHGIYPVSGGSTGPGYFEGTFDIKHAQAIRDWFASR
jgi:hypothetical protein